jgi:hypothetical protein
VSYERREFGGFNAWGHKRSIMALGHKMLRTIYAMLSKKTHYVDKTVDYEALMVARSVPSFFPGSKYLSPSFAPMFLFDKNQRACPARDYIHSAVWSVLVGVAGSQSQRRLIWCSLVTG